jgi:nicotinamide riboside kinase
MSDKKTIIINLYGGPGTGKSTSAAYFYYLLKAAGENVELVREYVKDWAWEGRKISNYDQIYFLGKQVRRESMLYGKVDWIVTDSPVMMNLYYAQRYCPIGLAEGIRASTLSFYRQGVEDGHKHIHVMLKRNKPYASEGRYQTEAEAKEIDEGVHRVLADLKMPIVESFPDEPDLMKVLETIRGSHDRIGK